MARKLRDRCNVTPGLAAAKCRNVRLNGSIAVIDPYENLSCPLFCCSVLVFFCFERSLIWLDLGYVIYEFC